MNVSLFIIVLMLIIISILLWQFFIEYTKKNTFSPGMLKPLEKKEKSQLRENLKTQMLDFSILLPIPENKPEPTFQQKILSFDHCLYLMAPTDENFMGYALLQGLQNVGLIYGEKGLFYYFIQNTSIFSVAPSILPYRFDIEQIGLFKTPSLKFTLITPGESKTMEKIAQALADELEGVVRC